MSQRRTYLRAHEENTTNAEQSIRVETRDEMQMGKPVSEEAKQEKMTATIDQINTKNARGGRRRKKMCYEGNTNLN